ncbi:DUF4348 domain-containing protein [Prolixibacter denitrificans]|jgi:hypothetical protein|uniref:Uncharacterized protein DUF4348 n=1 Tax=Prolixibacter denitrificans TaxID=1541063 RepID=A0A2P8CF64_9BACT|nr:DUF4348 domain-containing protein [Prolixibacter denitrificans]PSK83598.1 uncharacterized protein DUF4348 [Prolixibacter denitrificans]
MKRQIANHLPVTLLILVGLLWLSLPGCHTKKEAVNTSKANPEETATTKSTSKAVEDFDQFYNRFHNDSTFQMSRLKFPIGGAAVDVDGTTPWTKKNWHIMKTEIYDIDTTQYKVTYHKTPTEFTQHVWLPKTGFSNKCRFELIGKKWYLVYCLDENL